MSVHYSTGGVDLDGDVYPATFDCYDCGLSLSWPVTPGLPAAQDPVAAPMLDMIKEHDEGGCEATQAAEAQAEKQHASGGDFLLQVRNRDGDQCRYCRVVISFGSWARRSRGCYMVVDVDAVPFGPENVVVACGRCEERQIHREERGHTAAQLLRPLPPPEFPVYSAATWDWLNRRAAANVPVADLSARARAAHNLKGLATP